MTDPDRGGPPEVPPHALEAERRRAADLRAELLDALERDHALAEICGDFAVIALAPDGRVTRWGAAAERLFGYTAGEALALHSRDLFTDEDRAAGLPERELRAAADAGGAADENWQKRKGGERFWASGFSAARRDAAGHLSGFVKVVRDLSRWRDAEDALREGELRLRAAMAAAGVGTWLWHFPTDRQTLDTALHALLGAPEGRSVRGLEDFLSYIHPEDRGAVAAAFDRCVRTGADLAVEFRVPLPGGVTRWLLDRGTLVRGASGRPEYLVGACVDVTARKTLEEALRRANEGLERRVEQRTEELREAQARALRAERMAAAGEVAAGLSHDSRNALQRAQACLTLLELRLRGRPEELDLVHRAREAQEELGRIYEGLQHYAAPLRLAAEPVDLAEVWREAWDALSWRPGRERAVLREQVGGFEPRVAGDRFHLGRVFRNLFENALVSGADPVEVTVSCSEATLGGRAAVRVSVRDNGPGFPPAVAARAFEPYVTTKTRGTGLGLAVCRRVVEAHGGAIALGAGGPGAEVVFTLPRDGPAGGPPRPDGEPPQPG